MRSDGEPVLMLKYSMLGPCSWKPRHLVDYHHDMETGLDICHRYPVRIMSVGSCQVFSSMRVER